MRLLPLGLSTAAGLIICKPTERGDAPPKKRGMTAEDPLRFATERAFLVRRAYDDGHRHGLMIIAIIKG